MTLPDSRIACDAAKNALNVAAHKAALRTEMLVARRALTDLQRKDAVEKIGSVLVDWITARAIKTLAVYSPLPGEPDLMITWATLSAAGIALALPVVITNNAPLAFVAWQPGDVMTRDAFGVAIPALPHRHVTPDALVVPCLGITPQRIRLGYGGGFYDRTLAVMPSVITIGIAFDCNRIYFTAQAHDVALQAVVTESGVF